MRRFEFSEGTSNKFWEVDVEGTAVTTRWGRIGTSGQSKTKTFASPAKAQAEVDTLVREKAGKGYVEIAVAAPAQALPTVSPPRPSPVVTSPPIAKVTATKSAAVSQPAVAAGVPARATLASEVATGPIAWPDALRRRMYARRRSPAKLPPIDVDKARNAIAEQFSLVADNWSKSKSLDDPSVGPVLKAAIAHLRAPAKNPPTNAEVEGAVFAMMFHRQRFELLPQHDELVDEWLAVRGAAFAVEAIVASLSFVLSVASNTRGVELIRTTAPAYAITTGGQGQLAPAAALANGSLSGWGRLRARLTQVDDAAWNAGRARAEELRSSAPLVARVDLSFLFPDCPDWAAADTRELLATHKTYRGVGALLASLADPALMTELIDAHPQLWGLFPGGGWKPDVLEMCATMIEGAGPAAAQPIAKLFDRGISSEWKRECADALALIDSDEAAGLMAERLDAKEMLAAATEAFLRSPRRAMPALASRVGGGRAAQPAEALLAMIVKQDPTLVAELAPTLPDAARNVVESMRARQKGTSLEAEPLALPRVLRDPPWLQKKKRAAAFEPVMLAVAPYPESMHWQAGQKEAWLGQGAGWGHWTTNMTPEKRVAAVLERFGVAKVDFDKIRDPEKLRAAIVQNATGSWHMPAMLALLPDHIALAIWNALPPRAWSFYSSPEWFLAKHELATLPALLAIAETQPREIIDYLLPFRSTKIARLMAHAHANLKTARTTAQRWLLTHDECAAIGLVPDALGVVPKERAAASSALRFLAQNGREQVVITAAARYGDAAVAAVRAVLAFDPLDLYPTKLPKMPSFFQAGALTRPLLADKTAALPLTAVENVATMAAFSRLDEPYAGLAQVREACDRVSLAQMAWDLFFAWLLAGAPSKEAWAMNALAYFGDDDCARKLAPLIRQWPGEAAHARAVAGLDVLAAIGTDVALMHLNGIAQKVKFKGLQERAREKIALVADQRGLTPDELGDRLVPDLGLDDRGTVTLDFGPRQFAVGFDEHLRPLVRDSEGKPLSDLPKPNKSDDAEKAAAATATWKALKKDVKTLASQQLLRLELAMCARRRWTPEVFRMFLVEHPLLQHLVRRLVWGVFDDNDRLIAAFRVSEDGSFADANDDAFTLPENVRIGLAHSLELSADLAARFGQLFGDYEILQPFKQLGREAFTINGPEKTQKQLMRFDGVKVPTLKVLGLESRGWRRGAAQDGGGIWWFAKPLPGNVEAHLTLDPGIIVGMVNEHPEQKLGAVTIESPGSWSTNGTRSFGELDAIVFSEIVRDLEVLRA